MVTLNRKTIFCCIFWMFCMLSVGAQDDVALSAGEQEQLLEQKKNEIEESVKNLEKKQEELNELEKQFASARTPTTKEVLDSFKGQIETYGGRAYKLNGKKFPSRLKCTTADYRTFHGCLELRFFDPSARVYFDTGTDDVNEIDIFNDGNLNITVDLVSIYFPWRLGRAEFFDSWSWGPVIGAGISSAAQDSADGNAIATSAPVVLFSIGGMLEYKLETGVSFSFEAGRSTGFSSDESLGDIDDSAVFVGLRINVPIGERQKPKSNE